MEEIKEEEEEFIKACRDDYEKVKFIIGFVNDKTSIPDDEEDKLIYNINKILFTPNPNPENNNERLKKIIELINHDNVRQIARNIFVLLHYHDLMENNYKSWGEHLLRDLIKEDKIVETNKKIFKKEYEYVYNKPFDTLSPDDIDLKIVSIPKQRESIPKQRESVPEPRKSIPKQRESVPEPRKSIPRRLKSTIYFTPLERQRTEGGKLYKNNRNDNKK
jgi:hypothetical protein